MRYLALAVLAGCVSLDDTPSTGKTCPEKAFCDDFEREVAAVGWTEQGKLAGASVAIDNTTGVSGTRSVRFEVAPDSPEGRLHLTRGIDENATQVVISFSAKMTANVNLAFLTVELGPDLLGQGDYDTILLGTGDTGIELRETVKAGADFKDERIAVSNIPSDRFARFTLTIDLAGKTAAFKDDASGVEKTKPLNLPHAKPRELRLGIAYTGANARPAKASMWFDDVVVK